jgi:serine/threonine-protein kinase
MSPEQMRAPRNVDPRTDIWSIGAILYHLLGGRPPYVAESIPQLCTMMLEADPEPLRRLRPDLTPEIEQIVARCLARNITQRWTSVGEVALALQPFASPASRVHVERASRVLSSGDRLISAQRPAIPGAQSSGVTVRSVTPTAQSPAWEDPIEGGLPQRLSGATPPAIPTQEAWESARARAGGEPKAAPRPSRRWILPLVAGVVLLAGGGFFALYKGGSQEAASADLPKAPSKAVVLATEPAAVAPPVAAAAAVTLEPTPTETPAPAEKIAKVAEPSASGTARVPKGPAPRPPPERPKQGQGGLTDFGGRH